MFVLEFASKWGLANVVPRYIERLQVGDAWAMGGSIVAKSV